MCIEREKLLARVALSCAPHEGRRKKREKERRGKVEEISDLT